MVDAPTLSHRYDRAAFGWGDKMRALGYADAYLGFLAHAPARAHPGARVCDIGCGSGAFAEAWLGIYGSAARVTLLDPSRAMLGRAQAALSGKSEVLQAVAAGLEEFEPSAPLDHLLAAHVLEHVPDPARALRRIRTWVLPGAQLWLVASKPHWCNAIIWMQWRHRTFTEDMVAKLLEDAGWRLDHIHAFPSGPPSRTSRGYLATAT